MKYIIFLSLILALSFPVSASSETIDIQFYNTDIRDVFRLMGSTYDVNIVPDSSVSGEVTIHLSKVSLDEAIHIIADTYNLAVVMENNIYKVSTKSDINLTYYDNYTNLYCVNLPLLNIIQYLAKKASLNMVYLDEIIGNISLNIHNSPLDDALSYILASGGYTYEKRGGAYFVSKLKEPATSPYTITYEDGLLSLDMQNESVTHILREISMITNINVVPDHTVSGNVSGFISNMDFETALTVFLEANGMELVKEDDFYYVTQTTARSTVTYRDELLSVKAQNEDLRTLLNKVSASTGVNIIMDRDISGSIDILFTNLPLNTALIRITESQGFRVIKREDSFLIRRASQTTESTVFMLDNGHLDLDIYRVNVTQVLREISEVANIPLAIYTTKQATITNIQVENLPPTEAISLLLSTVGLSFIIDEGVYKIIDGFDMRPETISFLESKVIYLKYLKADDVFSMLPASIPSQNLRILTNQNALVVTGTNKLISMVSSYIELIDLPEEERIFKMVKIGHIRASEALSLIPDTIAKANISIHEAQNSLIVSGTTKEVGQIKSFIDLIDLPTPQIIFDVLIVECTQRDTQKLGFSGLFSDNTHSTTFNLLSEGTPLAATFDTALDAVNTFRVTLNTLLQEGKAVVRANPRITTLNGHQASFSVVTTNRYWDPRYKDENESETQGVIRTVETGIQLRLKPWVSASGDITVEIEPQISDSAGTGASGLPQTNDRSVSSTVRIQDGQTIVMAGLIQVMSHESVNKVPFLGDIPIIGNLFTSTDTVESESEFIVAITPYLIPYEEQGILGLSDMEVKHIMQELPGYFEK